MAVEETYAHVETVHFSRVHIFAQGCTRVKRLVKGLISELFRVIISEVCIPS